MGRHDGVDQMTELPHRQVALMKGMILRSGHRWVAGGGAAFLMDW